MRLTLQAQAKLNLTLEVLGKRDDGYHEIRSVMSALALHDTVHVEPASDLRVRCDLPGLAATDNLAYRAAQLLRQTTGHKGGARVIIEKAIPVAAGLGGGSSDAAATLLGLDRLWHTELSRQALASLAGRIGSDVPFFIFGGTALASGRGEVIQPLPRLPGVPVLLVHPPLSVSTPAIYGSVTPDAYSDGAASLQFAARAAGTPVTGWELVNALQPYTCRAHPVVGEILAALAAWGAMQSLMCGSGPTCFALFAEDTTAHAAAERARARGWDAWVTRFA